MKLKYVDDDMNLNKQKCYVCNITFTSYEMLTEDKNTLIGYYVSSLDEVGLLMMLIIETLKSSEKWFKEIKS